MPKGHFWPFADADRPPLTPSSQTSQVAPYQTHMNPVSLLDQFRLWRHSSLGPIWGGERGSHSRFFAFGQFPTFPIFPKIPLSPPPICWHFILRARAGQVWWVSNHICMVSSHICLVSDQICWYPVDFRARAVRIVEETSVLLTMGSF